MAGIKSWLKAMRLRTLPLSLATVLTGNFLVLSGSGFSPLIFIFTISTTIFLQILSNLANDLGDHLKGTDNDNRVGPARTTQTGEITVGEMKKAVFIFIIFSLASGITLLLVSKLSSEALLTLFLTGVGAILAAVFYTLGKRPYGYRALGDFFVFLFFGIVGVCGSFYLHTGLFFPQLLLPAAAIGCFSAAVLNLNNMRDRVNDKENGKITLVVLLGQNKAKIYHVFLIIVGWLSITLFMLEIFSIVRHLIFYLALPLFVFHLIRVLKTDEPKRFDPELKRLAIASFLFSLLFGISIID